jgi:hypothetical protein
LPQSAAVSSPFFTPSVHAGARHTPLWHTPLVIARGAAALLPRDTRHTTGRHSRRRSRGRCACRRCTWDTASRRHCGGSAWRLAPVARWEISLPSAPLYSEQYRWWEASPTLSIVKTTRMPPGPGGAVMSMPPEPFGRDLRHAAVPQRGRLRGRDAGAGAAAFFHFAVTPVLSDHGDGRQARAIGWRVDAYQSSRFPERCRFRRSLGRSARRCPAGAT